MKTGVYLRISDDREGRELGVTRQHEDALALVQRAGGTVVDIYRDNDRGASARSRKPRPDYQRLLADARAGRIDTIVAYTTGRLTRRPREHEDLIDLAVLHGVRYMFVASPSFDLNTSAGRRVARILAATDAGEAEDIAERVQRETRQRAEQGRHHGGPRAYGITGDGTGLVEDEAERVRGWYATILAGGSISSIRKQLAREGVLTPTRTTKKDKAVGGRPWHDSSIRVVLLNERNAGVRLYRGARYAAANPPIVDEATFEAVRAILEDPGRKTNHEGAARKHLGAGLYLCERCSGKAVRTSYNGTRARLWRVYVCGVRDGGCGRSWKAEPIDAWVHDLVAAVLGREDGRSPLLPKPRVDGLDARALHAERVAIEGNLKALAMRFATARGATLAALEAGIVAGEARLAEIDALLANAGGADAATAILAAADPVAEWRALQDVARCQAIVRGLMTITLGTPIRGRAEWDPRKFITVEPKGQK